MEDKNLFGGGNPNAVYTPMSEDEQEVIARLIADDDFHVHLKGWGWVHRPKVTFGDLRVRVPVAITFQAPDIPQPVYSFELELWGSGHLLFNKEYPVANPDGSPLMVCTGFHLPFIWDIAIRHMDPKLVKALKPGAGGLTSRWFDRDTGNATFLGNTRLGSAQKLALERLREGELEVAQHDKKALQKARIKEKRGGSGGE